MVFVVVFFLLCAACFAGVVVCWSLSVLVFFFVFWCSVFVVSGLSSQECLKCCLRGTGYWYTLANIIMRGVYLSVCTSRALLASSCWSGGCCTSRALLVFSCWLGGYVAVLLSSEDTTILPVVCYLPNFGFFCALPCLLLCAYLFPTRRLRRALSSSRSRRACSGRSGPRSNGSDSATTLRRWVAVPSP